MRAALLAVVVAIACGGCTCRRDKDEAHATNEKAKKTWSVRTIASQQVQPYGLALDGDFVWWTTRGKTRACEGTVSKAKTSGGAAIVVIDRLCTPYGVALDADHVYWTEHDAALLHEFGGVARAPKDGSFRDVTGYEESAFAIAARADAAFSTSLTDHAVTQWTWGVGVVDGSEVGKVRGAAFGLAVDANAVYWSDADDGVIMRAERGAPPALIADSLKKPVEIAIDDLYVYWSELDGRCVARAPKKGGTVETIARGDFRPRALAVDDRFVWFVATADGRILRAPKSGGAVETIAFEQKGPSSIAVDARSVYWTNSDDGTVMAVDKE